MRFYLLSLLTNFEVSKALLHHNILYETHTLIDMHLFLLLSALYAKQLQRKTSKGSLTLCGVMTRCLCVYSSISKFQEATD